MEKSDTGAQTADEIDQWSYKDSKKKFTENCFSWKTLGGKANEKDNFFV